MSQPPRRLISILLVLILAALVHVDWHFARPLDQPPSLDWSTHWVFAIAFFGVAGWYIARRWPDRPWRAAIWNVALALVLGHGIEPLFPDLLFGEFRYPVGKDRWIAFLQSVVAGLPTLALVLWAARRRSTAVPTT